MTREFFWTLYEADNFIFNLEHYFLPYINGMITAFNISHKGCIIKQHTKVTDHPEVQCIHVEFPCLHSWTQINAKIGVRGITS
jgi:hypothetical protein